MKALLAHILLFSLLGQIACNPWKFTRPSVNTKTVKRSQPLVSATPLLDPPPGQRCSGRNYQGRRCCTPENPCEEGEGDCDGPGDGGGHDGHKGCKGDLQCGSNNCGKFGLYFHEKDDCCEKPSANTQASQSEVYIPGTPLEPKEGQRCRGRNFEPGRHCCTPENPCNEGEGDCDGPDDGGQHDGHAGCKGSLVCGTNNCKKFGAYYHEKDDCCESPFSPLISKPVKVSDAEVFSLTKRCRGRNFNDRGCCSSENPCVEGEGDCENNKDCNGDLVCGNNNCKDFDSFFHEKDDCCIKPETPNTKETQGGPRCRGRNFNERGCCSFENPCVEGEGDCEQDNDCNGDLVCGNNNCKAFGSFFHPKDDCCIKPMVTSVEAVTRPAFPLTEPFPGQKCSGRNYQGRRCCTPENPCDEGEGDCDGPGDGGGHDGHKGCKGDLVCGSNNCMQFGIFYHEKDDCCEKPTASNSQPETALFPGALLEPPPGQRCSGRNYQSRRCCTPDNPCDEGEGDCDGPGDGGGHDGHKGCKGDLECGSNNCLKFGAYFHAKDDCCEKPGSSNYQSPLLDGWGSWEAWSQCSKGCGVGKWSRTRDCTGPSCRHNHQSQERFCNTQPCGQPEVDISL